MKLICLRHGESYGNVANRLSRRGDHSLFTPDFLRSPSSSWHLTEEGKNQAIRMRDKLKFSIDFAYVSPYVRTVETFTELQISVPYALEPLLVERNWGLIDVAPSNDPLVISEFRKKTENPYTWTPPGGESLQDTRKRVCGFLKKLPTSGTILVVGHEEFFQVMLLELLNLPPEKLQETRIKNCEALIFTIPTEQTEQTTLERLRAL